MENINDFSIDAGNIAATLADLISMPERILEQVMNDLDQEKTFEDLLTEDNIVLVKKQLISAGTDLYSFEKEIEELEAFKINNENAKEFDNKQQVRVFDFLIKYLKAIVEKLKKEGLVIPTVVYISKLSDDAILPIYSRLGDAGCDICILEDTIIPAKARVVCKTGIAIALPIGYEVQVRLRSSIAFNTPLLIPNAPGTIDSGYRGDISIILFNTSDEPFEIKKGERIAQLVLSKVERINWEIVDDVTKIGQNREGGFGSTGK